MSCSWRYRVAVGSSKVAAYVEQHVLDKAGDKRRRNLTTRTSNGHPTNMCLNGPYADNAPHLDLIGKVCPKETSAVIRQEDDASNGYHERSE